MDIYGVNNLKFVKLETTTRCNANCLMCCPRDGKNFIWNRDMDLNLFKKAIDELETYRSKPNEEEENYLENIKVPDSCYLSLEAINWIKKGNMIISPFGLGEPFLNKNFLKMLGYLKDKNFYVILNTNGSLLNEDLSKELLKIGSVDEIYFSIDSHIKEVYEKIRRGLDFDIVIRNLKMFNNMITESKSARPKLNVSAVMQDLNLNHLKDMCMFFDKMSIGIKFLNDARKYRKVSNVSCAMINHGLVIRTNGDAVKCSFDYDSSTVVGNIKENTIAEIWSGTKNKKILEMSHGRKLNALPLCRNFCTY